MKDNLTIHVGLHKTGTTFLQKEIFSKIPDINFVRSAEIWKIHIDKNKINLISNECLSSDEPHFWEFGATGRYEILNHLKQLFFDAKIILGIRNFDAWLKSCYKQYIVCGGILKFDDYCNKYRKHFINMQEYEDKIRDTFTDVLVYRQEDLLRNRDKTINNICRFIGVNAPEYSNVKRNISPKPYQLELRRRMNKFMKSEFNDAPFFTDMIIRELIHIWSNKEV